MSYRAAIDSYYMSAESQDVQLVRRLQTMPNFILKRDICYRFTCFTMNPFHAYILGLHKNQFLVSLMLFSCTEESPNRSLII